MNTLHEHLKEMLYAVDKQRKIPRTRLFGNAWIDSNWPICDMCTAGAWHAQKYGRRDLIDLDSLTAPVREAMIIMDYLRVFNVNLAYEYLHGQEIDLGLPSDIVGDDSLVVTEAWRASQGKLLLWLTANNL